MASKGVIRPLQGGGCSLCRASEKNVGKKKCKHILNDFAIDVEKHRGMNIVRIDGLVDGAKTSLSGEANEKQIESYLTNLSKGLSPKKHDSILNMMRTWDDV